MNFASGTPSDPGGAIMPESVEATGRVIARPCAGRRISFG
jgi:hypothetical protein